MFILPKDPKRNVNVTLTNTKPRKFILPKPPKVSILDAFGAPVKLNKDRSNNCLSCLHFMECNNEEKSFSFSCSLFKSKDLKHAKKLLHISSNTKKQVRARDYADVTSESYDIEKMVEAAIDNMAAVPRDLKIDDRDIPKAENLYDFLVNPRFLNFSPWAKQLQIGLNLFNDYCYNPKCTDVKYMKNIPTDASTGDILDKCTLLVHGKCPKCGMNRIELANTFKMPMYTELAGIAGQRSAKSSSVVLYTSYHKHRYLKMSSPNLTYGLLENETIPYTVTATTYSQAHSTLYTPILYILQNSPWFMEYNSMLDFYGQKYGEELYRLGQEFCQYRHKRTIFSAAAPDQKNMRGRTRICTAIDEIGWMFALSEKAIKLNANEVYTALKNSLFTINAAYNRLIERGFYDALPTLMCNVSSPSSISDKIMQLKQEAKTNKKIYAYHYSTLEMNPTLKESDFEDIIHGNPERWKRDFLAIPPDASNAFITNKKALLSCISPMHKNLISLRQKAGKTSTGLPITTGEVSFRKTNNTAPKILALDAGWKKNSFAGAVMSIQESLIDPEKEAISVDAVFEIIPKENAPVNMANIYEEIIKPIIEEYDIKLVTADRWNSLKLLQDIESELEVPYIIYSLVYADFSILRECLYNGLVILPQPEMKVSEAFMLANASKQYPFCFIDNPVSHFMLQSLTVQDLMGKKVDKADNRTDDIFRAVALGHAMLSDSEVVENYLFEDSSNNRTGSLAVIGSYSTGSMGAKSSMSSSFAVSGSLSGFGSSSSGGNSNVFSRK